jgi:GNAT superfamily N-acetyltransferase
MNLEFCQLAERPEHLETVGRWIYHEWWEKPGSTVEVVLEKLRQHNQLDRIPFTVLALLEGQLVGSCCVIERDCSQRPDLTPWIAAVYVKEEFRNRAIASKMLQWTFDRMLKIGEDHAYLTCSLEGEKLYGRNGWKLVERDVGPNKDSVMLRVK